MSKSPTRTTPQEDLERDRLIVTRLFQILKPRTKLPKTQVLKECAALADHIGTLRRKSAIEQTLVSLVQSGYLAMELHEYRYRRAHRYWRPR